MAPHRGGEDDQPGPMWERLPGGQDVDNTSRSQQNSQNHKAIIAHKGHPALIDDAHVARLVQRQTSSSLQSTQSLRRTLSRKEHDPRSDSADIEFLDTAPKNSDTNFVQSKAINDIQIPENIVSVRRSLLKYTNDPHIGLDALAEHANITDQRIGESLWHVEPRNRHLVLAAIEEITPDQVRSARDPRSWYIGAAALQGNSWILDANQLLFARERGIVTQLPNIREDELMALSNGDVLVKALAVTQVVWLFLQLSSRAAHHQPIPQLEILVLSIASCAFLTYIATWKKPQDVKTAQIIKVHRYPTPSEVIVLAARSPICWGNPRRTQCIPNNHPSAHYRKSKNIGIHHRLASGVLASMLFGGLQCLAWNSVFPTNTERTLWRVSCVITITLPAIFYLVALCAQKVARRRRVLTWKRGMTPAKIIGIFFFFVFWPIYLPVRLYVLVESFRSLLYLPPEAFTTTWVANAPQFS